MGKASLNSVMNGQLAEGGARNHRVGRDLKGYLVSTPCIDTGSTVLKPPQRNPHLQPLLEPHRQLAIILPEHRVHPGPVSDSGQQQLLPYRGQEAQFWNNLIIRVLLASVLQH